MSDGERVAVGREGGRISAAVAPFEAGTFYDLVEMLPKLGLQSGYFGEFREACHLRCGTYSWFHLKDPGAKSITRVPPWSPASGRPLGSKLASAKTAP